MSPIDYVINLILSGILIVGVYQFYFFTQRHTITKVREFSSAIDEKIPFWPSWSWIYSFLYYPAILYINWIVEDSRHFIMIVFSYIVLLVMQMTFFMLFPVSTPSHWRSMNTGKSWSEKFLLFVQKFDDSSNCFPSMHVSVATLTALLAYSTLGPWVFLFPILIALSCMFTKQHYIIDLPAGAVLGWAAYEVYCAIL
ncbi:phosphatase PAP2 family protein [Limnobaculum zhutongyuii]|uniref:Phosphatase PAP2 family protein n=1 Tax=Limnobaculum zhutongyuii TaxID=2498113 RepID=A0A411WKD4_9GAMM|nr:phosphatase PAP2 family protein [Limnobaculum zhutongyuii]QBH96674.1 phosphatase PAP2 family protein [Limnobaculum zhutongyuii]TQS90294.1 phosphatase PAP2 family protein [Limnobaculum zhutongyuii]